jgi:maltose alpha-D-glucosyltransferase / alpha-amylase
MIDNDTDPLWYKDGVIYQTHVRAFFDSNNDGIGDFQGLTQKLDYLQDLGINILWLLPFYPSPLRDDGYDIADYTSVNPSYGTLADFKLFLKEAHRRDIRVVTELVINHTSDQHPWFQKSRRAKKGSPWRDFYVWSDTPDRYTDARIIFKDFETSNWTWDPVAKAYYWHRFFSHQPDLNFENPAVHEALMKALDFWMDLGVDAFRLDAIPYLFEREGTTCENLPETHDYLKKVRAHMDANHPGRMLLAEANQWPEDSLPYFGDGDECHMAFHFPVMPRMYMALAQEDRFPILDIMEQTPAIPENCQWAMFLRNHDELTLEMVTDEDRDYMWRTYARDKQARINLGIRRRLAPLLDNHRGRIHLMNGLLFSFPGTPIIYYGDEIGMGDNIYLGDRNGVRTPMQWSGDRNAGFSRANPQRLFFPVIIDPQYHYEQVNVESQQSNPYSLLWWMKRLISLRKRYQAFGRGTMEFVPTENRKILAYVRRHGDETILVVANLSRLVQCFELDLSGFRGMVPVELSGGTPFPAIEDKPYFLNLGPFAFYWFVLQSKEGARQAGEIIPAIPVSMLADVLDDRRRDALSDALVSYLQGRRWFSGKGRVVTGLNVRDTVELPGCQSAVIALVDVDFADGEPQTYQIPLAVARARRAEEQGNPRAMMTIATLNDGAVLYEAVADEGFATCMLDTIARRKPLRGEAGEVSGVPTRALKELRGTGELHGQLLRSEQSNTAIVYGQELFLKLFRRLEPGTNIDVEVMQFLNDETDFRNVPRVAGSLVYTPAGADAASTSLAVLQSFAPNSGDAWVYTLDALGRYFDALLSDREELATLPAAMPDRDILKLASAPVPELAREAIGASLDDAALLGRRTGELHRALASRSDIAAFAPEPFTPHYQRGLYQSIRSQISRTFQSVKRRAKEVPELAELLAGEKQLQEQIRPLVDEKISVARIRTHGDFHLGQVLRSGNDFVIIDFEGEPARPISERRLKRSALRDVAGMLRSYDYAASTVLFGQAPGSVIRPEDAPALELAARYWVQHVSATFLRGYLEASEGSAHLPKTREEIAILLRAHLIEKALYEINYEIANRPEWVRIPLRGLLDLMK